MHSDRAPEQSELLQQQEVEYIMIPLGETEAVKFPFLTPQGKKMTININKTTLREKGKKLNTKLNLCANNWSLVLPTQSAMPVFAS